MKTAIVTIESLNYGNRLQNYALQHVLANLGYSAETIRRSSFSAKKRIKRFVRSILKKDKVTAFYGFDNQNIMHSSQVLCKDSISPDLASSYDVFVIGSDQVWNPNFPFNSELDYLPMVSSRKKISYAASFGVSSIEHNRGQISELLCGISRISVRERAGANIVRDLTGREAAVVLDPTMLLSVEEWERVSRRPDCVKTDAPFLLKYVLGNDVNESAIAKLAAQHSWNIVDVMDDSLGIGPAEFVWLISHSELVCTDSFHASVFALLHHRPLAIFERVSANADMSSRFSTLCSLFGLSGHRSSEPEFCEKTIFGTDWRAFDNRLAELRNFSMQWLKESLESVNG